MVIIVLEELNYDSVIINTSVQLLNINDAI